MLREPYTTRELSESTFPDFERLAVKQGRLLVHVLSAREAIGRGLSSDERIRRSRKDRRTLVRQGRMPSSSTMSTPRSAGANTAAKTNSRGSTHDASIARRPFRQRPRSSGGSRASSWTQNTEGGVWQSSRSKRYSSRSRNRVAVSSRHTPLSRRKWPRCPSGAGSERPACSEGKASRSSSLLGRAAF